MKNIFLALFCFTTLLGFSQSPVNKEDNTYTLDSKIYPLQKDGEASFIVRNENDTIYWDTEEPCDFKGGPAKIYQFIGKIIKYPAEAKANGISGKVYVHFIISEEGEMEEAKVSHKVHPLLDEEALRVVSKLTNWTAGKHKGKNVKMGMNLPINFVLK